MAAESSSSTSLTLPHNLYLQEGHRIATLKMTHQHPTLFNTTYTLTESVTMPPSRNVYCSEWYIMNFATKPTIMGVSAALHHTQGSIRAYSYFNMSEMYHLVHSYPVNLDFLLDNFPMKDIYLAIPIAFIIVNQSEWEDITDRTAEAKRAYFDRLHALLAPPRHMDPAKLIIKNDDDDQSGDDAKSELFRSNPSPSTTESSSSSSENGELMKDMFE